MCQCVILYVLSYIISIHAVEYFQFLPGMIVRREESWLKQNSRHHYKRFYIYNILN